MQSIRKNKNGGFSLIELIVVVAIMAVVLSGVIYGVYLLGSGDEKKASKMISGQLSAHRSNTLAKSGDWQFELVNDNGRYALYSYQGEVLQEHEQLGSRISVFYAGGETPGAEVQQLAAKERLVITFVQGSGKVADVKLVSDGSVNQPAEPESGTSIKDSGYLLLRVSGKKEGGQTIKLYYETGKVVVN